MTPLEFIIWFFVILGAVLVVAALVFVFYRKWASERRQQMMQETAILKVKRQELDRLSQTQASLIYLKMVGKELSGTMSDSERESLRRITSLVQHFLSEEAKTSMEKAKEALHNVEVEKEEQDTVFLNTVKTLLGEGYTESEVAEKLQLTVGGLRTRIGQLAHEKKDNKVAFARLLKSLYLANWKIAEIMEIEESTVRQLLGEES